MAISALSAATTACEELDWGLSNLELQKLLYLAHMTYLGRYGEPLISDRFEAWDYGPVVPSLYQKAKVFGAQPIEFLPSVRRNLRLPEHDVVREVVNYFSGKTPGELVDLTHRRNGAWFARYRPGERSIRIPDEDIREEYRLRTNELPGPSED